MDDFSNIDLSERGQFMEFLLSSSKVFFLTDKHLNLKYISPSIQKYLGYTPSQFIEQFYSQIITNHSKERLFSVINQIFNKQQNQQSGFSKKTIEMQIKLRDSLQEIRIAEITVGFIYDSNGYITAVAGIGRDITHKKALEDLNKTTQTRFFSLFENIDCGVVILNKSGNLFKILDINKKGLEFCGMGRAAVLKTDFNEFFSVIYDKATYQTLVRVSRTGQTEFSCVKIFSNGSISQWFNHYIYKLSNNELVIVTNNLTSIKQAEEKAKKSEKEKIDILDSLPDSFVLCNLNQKVLWANESALKAVGKNLPEVEGRLCFEIWNTTKTQCKKCPVIQTIQTGQISEVEVKSSDGSYWFIKAIPQFNEKKELVSVLEFSQDITEKRKAQHELIANEKKFRQYFVETPVCYQSINENLILLDVNPAWEQTLGYEKQDVVGRSFLSFIFNDFQSTFKNHFQLFKQSGDVKNYLIPIVRKDERVIWIELFGKMVFNRDGTIKQSHCIFRDITEEKQAKENLRESEERFRILFESLSDAIIITDNALIIWNINTYAKILTGIENVKALIGTNYLESVVKEDRTIILDVIRKIIDNDFTEKYYVEYRMYREDGAVRTVGTIARKFYYEKERQGILLNIRDITENKEKEHLLEQQKIEIEKSYHELVAKNLQINMQTEELLELNSTKDKLFSIIAHDLRTPFNHLLGLTDILIEGFEQYTNQQLSEIIKILNFAARDGYNLLQNLMDWSRSQSKRIVIRRDNYELSSILNEVVRTFSYKLEEKNIKYICPSYEVWIETDKMLVSTIFRNLISNSLKYTDNGLIEVTFYEHKDFIKICVSDTGKGIDEERLKNIFCNNLVSSTKGTAGESGTGIGLIICKDFVEKLGGQIWVESNINIGTKFWFTLPL